MILESDIKLLASQRLADTPDGGGRMTGTVVQDGVDNNLFDDVSSLDRVYGNDSLRKLFGAILTDNTDKYLGARVIIDKGPDDPSVTANIFTTGSSFDVRSNAANRLESYLIGGSRFNGFLFENHVTNQRSIQICQRVNTNPPVPGETLYLVYREGQVDEISQYIRVTRVATEIRTFTDGAGEQGNYLAQITTCDISDGLRSDFPGTAANRNLAQDITKTVLKITVVADAGSYAGISSLAQAGAIGDTSVRVASIFSQIVPSSRTEVSALDQVPAASSVVTLATAPRLIQVPLAGHTYRIKIGQSNRGFNYVHLMRPLPAPGTVQVSYRALGRWYTITDNGDGTLGGNGTGTVNYTTGSISVTLQAFPDAASGVIFQWAEVASFTNRSGNLGFREPEFSFELEDRSLSPNFVTITWTSGGVLKTVTDNGQYGFSGPDMAGEVNYQSGLLRLRPKAMIDPGGQFSVSLQRATQVQETFTAMVDSAGFMAITLAGTPLAGSVGVAWGVTRNLPVTSGAVPSDGVYLANLSVYESFSGNGLTISKILKAVGQSTGATLVISGDFNQSNLIDYYANDDNAGQFVQGRGTVNYAAGTLSVKLVNADSVAKVYENDYEDAGIFNSANGLTQGALSGPTQAGGSSSASRGGGNTATTTVAEALQPGSNVRVTYITASTTSSANTRTLTPPAIHIDLCPYTSDRVVPGSVRFSWMGQQYDDFEGGLYLGRTESNPGTLSGSIDYTSGLATITNWVVAGDPAVVTVSSLWTRSTGYRTSRIYARTLAAPVKPGGFVMSVTDATGAQLILSADLDGELSGPHAIGRIDYESGVLDILFGDYMLDSTLSAADKAEWWYRADDVELNGKIFRPWPVLPETLRYNVVSYFYLPLDAAILGLDPVRLPQDGRVPIFRAGRVVVVHHTEALAPQVVANGQTVDVGRTRLAKLRVLGNDGLPITTGYSADLDDGSVTFSAVAGYSQPVTIEHRIEDESVCTEVQITGEIALLRQLTHTFPVTSTYVSTALLIGTLGADTTEGFSQQVWTQVWSDQRIGNAITAQYNQALFPIDVTNRGAVTERWACIFTSNTSFRVVGEETGEIAQGNINTTTAPENPATGVPYWSIDPLGWGAGWVSGNVLRFNTRGANFPLWVVRTVLQGPAVAPGSDQLRLAIRGDVNT
ncbi:MAG: hypothetical protein ACKVOO_12360 [Burkholderiaceae bacterium]